MHSRMFGRHFEEIEWLLEQQENMKKAIPVEIVFFQRYFLKGEKARSAIV
jgi:hypothetical protein